MKIDSAKPTGWVAPLASRQKPQIASRESGALYRFALLLLMGGKKSPLRRHVTWRQKASKAPRCIG